jgi:hypothetical protein
MAAFIKRVDSRIDENVQDGVMCQSCGIGTTAQTEPQSCRCGKTMEPHTFDFSQQIPGFVLIRCGCGRKVECQGFTTTCSCGRDYNWNGDELAPRSEWGQETGEHWYECY